MKARIKPQPYTKAETVQQISNKSITWIYLPFENRKVLTQEFVLNDQNEAVSTET
jgi:hypothetical protein